MARQFLPVSRNSPAPGSAATPFMTACGSPCCSATARASAIAATSPLARSIPDRYGRRITLPQPSPPAPLLPDLIAPAADALRPELRRDQPAVIVPVGAGHVPAQQ